MSDATTRVMLSTRLDPGVQLNDTYEIDERIASGGMGEVYRGHNIQTGEPVAIKTILPELADKEAIAALFKKEATTLGRLHHETIVRYYSFSRDPRLGRTYLAMEFVEGVSLADRIKDVPLTPDEVRRLFAKVADGLALAHAAKVIHRDLSPDNIILREGNVGRPTLIDFGIARNANPGEGTLIGGGFAGKFNFVSPEQLGIHNREVDGRSDIYSLGLVIAAALRGSPIEMGGSHVEVIEKRGTVPDLSDIDPGLRPLVEAMLQPNPDDRPADATVVSEWLKATANNGQTAAPTNGAVTNATGAPGIAFPTQPGALGAATGMPFAAQMSSPPRPTEPTVRIAAGSFGQPAGGSESPFGSAPAHGVPPWTGLPATTPPSADGPPPGLAGPPQEARKSSGAGRYAIAGGVLLLLVGGGAGAYMTGFIGPGDGKVDTQSTDQGSGSEQGDAKGDAKSQEHQDIGDAIKDALGDNKTSGGDKSTGTQTTGTQTTNTGGTDSGDTSTGTSGSQTTDNGSSGSDSGKGNAGDTKATGNETGDTKTTDTQDTNSGTTDSGTGTSGGQTTDNGTNGGDATGPDNGTQQTTDGLTKMVDVGVKWLRQYDGGRCFFVAVTSVTDKTINVKGFSQNTPAFKKLYDAFIDQNHFEPELYAHPVSEAQCAAVDFLKAVQPGAKDNPQLRIASDTLKIGDTLEVTVDKAGTRKLDLLLVDQDGFVHNMKSFAKLAEADGRSTFAVKLGGTSVNPDSPQMVIALTSPSGLAVPEGTSQAPAADLFPRLGREIEVMRSSVGVDFGYFLLSP